MCLKDINKNLAANEWPSSFAISIAYSVTY